MKKMNDFRLKKCPICNHFYCYIHEDMCSSCKAKGYYVETKRMENRLGFERKETKKLTLPKVRKKNDKRK